MKNNNLFKIALCTIALLIVFASCRHDKGKKGNNIQKPTPIPPPVVTLPELKLKSLKIHGEDATEGEVILKADQITADDIEAHFSYGDKADEIIKVTVEASPFVLDKTQHKLINLTVAEKNDKYKEWKGSVKVFYNSNIITTAGIEGGMERGVKGFTATKEQIIKLLQNEDLELELKGPYAMIAIASKDKEWTKCTIDGKEVSFKTNFQSFKSIVLQEKLTLGAIDETKEFKIRVKTETEAQQLKLKIKRLTGTVDIPDLKLIVIKADVITKENLPKLCDGVSKPNFRGTDPCRIEVRCKNDDVANCVIDASSPIEMKKKSIDTDEFYFARHDVTGANPSGKDVTVRITPKNTQDYHETTWIFHLDYQATVPLNVFYKFNNKSAVQLGATFKKDLEEGRKPLLNLKNASYLNMNFKVNAVLKEVIVNDVSFKEDSFTTAGVMQVFNHSLPVTADEKEVNVTFIPDDEGLNSRKTFEFRVKGDGNKETISPKLFINGDDANSFPDGFKSKLTDGSKPLHKVFRNLANIEFEVDEYTYTFLSNSIKINEEAVTVEQAKKGIKTIYVAKRAIVVNDKTPTEVKIEVVQKEDGIINPLIWEFKVQGGKEMPIFPKDRVSLFTINDVGKYGGEPLPQELLDNLTTATPYTYAIDANTAVVQVGWYADTDKMIEHAIFEVDGKATTVESVKNANTHFCSHTIELPNTDSHPVIIKIVPKEEFNYKELVYKFNLKSSGQLPQLPIKIWADETVRLFDNVEKEVDTDMPVISVISEQANDEEIMASVKINGENVGIEKKAAEVGEGFFYEAAKAVSVGVSATEFTTITISVTPKDASKYRETTFTLKLRATKSFDKNNGKFAFNQQGNQIVDFNVEWSGSQSNPDDHGAKSVIIKFYTESPHARVRYRTLFIARDKTYSKVFEEVITPYQYAKHVKDEHTTQKIQLAHNTPITVQAEVMPYEGNTDQDAGVFYFTFNPVTLLWNYQEGTNHGDYANAITELQTSSSGVKIPVIKIDKNQVQGGKIYLALSAWKSDFDCAVDNSGAVKFSELNVDEDRQWYKASIDVSSLQNATDEVEVSFPLLFKNQPSFTYKFKIKLQ